MCLAACAGGGQAPVVSMSVEPEPAHAPAPSPTQQGSAPVPPFHVIARGETLYSIAWRYGLDYRQVAQWNGVAPPYFIYAGRRLALRPPAPAKPAKATTTAPRPATQPRKAPEALTAPARDPSATKPLPAQKTASAESVDTAGTIRWQWPAKGKVVNAESAWGSTGLNIFGQSGQPIVAAAPGEIVYSGSGLAGYGKLIIIKHDDSYLSAYAHNDRLLAQEGARVAGGQQIAEMGSSGARQVMLHFEIRRNGKPVPPLQYLPR